MTADETSPKRCPLCDSATLVVITSGELFAAGIPPQWKSYRCDQGHVFLAGKSPSSKED